MGHFILNSFIIIAFLRKKISVGLAQVASWVAPHKTQLYILWFDACDALPLFYHASLFFHCPTSIANMWCFSPGRWQARWALTFHKLGAWWTFQLFGIFPDWCVRVVAAILLIGLARLLWGVLKGPFFPTLVHGRVSSFDCLETLPAKMQLHLWLQCTTDRILNSVAAFCQGPCLAPGCWRHCIFWQWHAVSLWPDATDFGQNPESKLK